MKTQNKVALVLSMLVLMTACAPHEKVVTVDGTEGCSLMYEYEEVVTPAIEQECGKQCADVHMSYSSWRCSDADLLECVCS